MAKYNRDSLYRLYEIGGADLALRYAELSNDASSNANDDYRIDVLSLRFYNGGKIGPSATQRQFAKRFAKEQAQYIYFQIEFSNPWKYIDHTFTLSVRYYDADNKLFGEVEERVETKPEWRTFWHCGGWGWQEPGYWTTGDYRVEVLIDGDYRFNDSFTIFSEHVDNKDPTSGLIGLEKWRSFFPSTNLFPSSLSDQQKQDEKLPLHGLGFDGWMERLNREFPLTQLHGKNIPSDDLGKFQCLAAIDRRYMNAMFKSRPGAVSEKVVQELLDIAADYQALLDAPMPEGIPVYSKTDLQTKLADTYRNLAHACATLHDYEQARQHYATAIDRYQALGKQQEVQRCRTFLDSLEFAQHGDVDKEISRLNQNLTKVEHGGVEHADLLIELGGIYRQNGENWEAEKLLLQAEEILDSLGGDPSGKLIADALTHSLLPMSQVLYLNGSADIETVMKINGFYRVLYAELSRVYKDSDPTRAALYRGKAAQRDSREHNDAFSRTMLDSLENLFRQL